MNKKKSIQVRYKRLLVINDHGIFGGGTENRIRTLVIKFLQDSFFEEIHILQKISVDITKIHTLPSFTKGKIFIHTLNNESCFLLTKKIIQKYSIDIVQCHNLTLINPVVILAAKMKKIPIIFYAHDYWPLCGYRSFINPHSFKQQKLCQVNHSFGRAHCLSIKAQVKHFFWKKIINLCTRGIATGIHMTTIYEKNEILKKKWKIITPWINPHFFVQKNNNKSKTKTKNKHIPHSILFVGSLLPFKGAFVAVQAMKLILKRFPNAQLLLVGSEQEYESAYRQELEKISQYDNTIKNIQFLGKKTHQELRLLHHSVTAFVFPTICMESFGQSWAEAMADGCPVIVSNISTLPEYINHKETGLLTRPNDPSTLAEAIMSLFEYDDFATTIAKNGTKYAKNHFSLERTYQELCRVYSEV